MGVCAVFLALLRACVVACGCVPACSCGCVCVLVWRARVGVCPRCCVRVWVWVCVGGAALVCAAPLLVVCCGGFLLSRTPWGAVPLARPGLASRFGMLLGVSPVL